QSPVAKFLESIRPALVEKFQATAGDLLLLVGDERATAATILGRFRIELAERHKLIPKNSFAILWVVDFPLLEWNPDERRWRARHPRFTARGDEDLPRLESDPGGALAKAYDLVLNGQEIGGGSIRIHQQAVQQRVFDLVGIGKEEARSKFGFLLDALEFGAPPMGGIAFGLDRLSAVLAGHDSIREGIAFPKTQKGRDPMTDAPAPASPAQLRELGIHVGDSDRTPRRVERRPGHPPHFSRSPPRPLAAPRTQRRSPPDARGGPRRPDRRPWSRHHAEGGRAPGEEGRARAHPARRARALGRAAPDHGGTGRGADADGRRRGGHQVRLRRRDPGASP